jgi:hypothetical protein
MRQTTSARHPESTNHAEGTGPRRRPTTLSEIERSELRVLESTEHFDEERTNPWFPPTGPEPARRPQ